MSRPNLTSHQKSTQTTFDHQQEDYSMLQCSVTSKSYINIFFLFLFVGFGIKKLHDDQSLPIHVQKAKINYKTRNAPTMTKLFLYKHPARIMIKVSI